MTFELKTLSPDAVSRALAKAERYRLLNERVEAESICLDALQIDPENNEARVTLLLAVTDQFGEDLPSAVTEALQVVGQLRDPYETGVLLRDYLGTPREGTPSSRQHGARSAGLCLSAGSDGVVRAGGGDSAAGKRRPVASVECVRGRLCGILD